MTARRYSHVGPVAQPHGMPLASVTMKALRAIYDQGIGWRVIAGGCGVNRVTLHRALCGGNVRASTRHSIRRFVERWKRSNDAMQARHMRRWSPARRAAHLKRKAAA